MQRSYRSKKYQWQFALGALAPSIILTLVLRFVFPSLPIYFSWLVMISLATFVYFGWDKYKARNDADVRIPEIVLHMLSLFGGFVGGFVGMQFFRHKTNFSENWIFPVVMGLALILHAVLLYFLIF